MHDDAARYPGSPPRYGGFQLTALVALRMLIGWHLFYEGLAKILNPYWTSAGYLRESQWVFSDLFIRLASNPSALAVADYLNQWGLLLMGLGLLCGFLTRTATVAGIVLLLLYYVAAPPLPGLAYTIPAEGAYLIVNKILVEVGGLLVLLAFPTGHLVGLDRIVFWKRSVRPAGAAPAHLEVAS